MPLPLIIGGIAAVAGLAGVGTGISGGINMAKANETMKQAQIMQQNALADFEQQNGETTYLMDSIGKQELNILASFEEFSSLIEKIQDRPEFKKYDKEGVTLPKYEAEDLKKVSLGANLLLGGVGGAAVGTAGGFAAAGATTSAVMALGTASTGTAISSLSGVAATNAVLAALGGGSIAAGGGGMALGSVVLGGATLGISLLVGGIIFAATGAQLSEKADEALVQAKRTRDDVNKIVPFLKYLKAAAAPFSRTLSQVEIKYRRHLMALDYIVNYQELKSWDDFTEIDKLMTQNTVLLVGVLFKMCQTNLVIKAIGKFGLNSVNYEGINSVTKDANKLLSEIK